jgi:hypothetical protein
VKEYCYAIVQSDGLSHELWDSWEQFWEATDEEMDDEDTRRLWGTRRTLPQLLADGWRPVREFALTAHADWPPCGLVLLERDT